MAPHEAAALTPAGVWVRPEEFRGEPRSVPWLWWCAEGPWLQCDAFFVDDAGALDPESLQGDVLFLMVPKSDWVPELPEELTGESLDPHGDRAADAEAVALMAQPQEAVAEISQEAAATLYRAARELLAQGCPEPNGAIPAKLWPCLDALRDAVTSIKDATAP